MLVKYVVLRYIVIVDHIPAFQHVSVARLRALIESDTSNLCRIVNVRGIGYRLEGVNR